MPGQIERDDAANRPQPGEPVSVVGRTDTEEVIKVTYLPPEAADPEPTPNAGRESAADAGRIRTQAAAGIARDLLGSGPEPGAGGTEPGPLTRLAAAIRNNPATAAGVGLALLALLVAQRRRS